MINYLISRKMVNHIIYRLDRDMFDGKYDSGFMAIMGDVTVKIRLSAIYSVPYVICNNMLIDVGVYNVTRLRAAIYRAIKRHDIARQKKSIKSVLDHILACLRSKSSN